MNLSLVLLLGVGARMARVDWAPAAAAPGLRSIAPRAGLGAQMQLVAEPPVRIFNPWVNGQDGGWVEDRMADFVENGRALPCFVAATLEAEGEVFAVLYPRDAPVQLARRHGPELVPIEPESIGDDLLEAAREAVAVQKGIMLMDTPGTLTVRDEELDDATRDSPWVVLETDGFEHDATVLAEFPDPKREVPVLVLETQEPPYKLGRQTGDFHFRDLTDEELAMVGEPLERLIGDFEDLMEGREEDLFLRR
jgi:hypothetical protein